MKYIVEVMTRIEVECQNVDTAIFAATQVATSSGIKSGSTGMRNDGDSASYGAPSIVKVTCFEAAP